MKRLFALLSVLLLICCCEAFALKFRRPSSPVTPVTRLRVIDPNLFYYNAPVDSAVDTNSLQAGLVAMQSSFLNTFSFRLVGSVLGNLLAGAVATFITINLTRFKLGASKKKQNSLPTIYDENSAVYDRSNRSISSEAWIKLLLCLFIDLVGDTSFLLPGVGEAEDLLWAPVAALAVRKLFDSNFLTLLEFSKEILPVTDVLPVATLAWLLENVFDDSDLARFLNLQKKRKGS